MSDQQPTTVDTWVPDWQAIDAAALDDPDVRRLFSDPATYDQGAQLHDERRTSELQRQAAAADLVMVRRDFLAQTKEMVDWLMGTCTAMGSDQAVYDELVALAATPPPTPGGDAG